MKRLSLFLALFSTTILSYGQGTVAFSNGFTTHVQTYDGSGNLISVPIGFPIVYGLFYGTNAGALNLSPTLGAPSTTTAGLIWVNGAISTSYALAGTSANDTVFIQVKAWSASFGSNWQAALAACVSSDPAVYAGVYFGETDIVQSDPLGASTGPGIPIWQASTGTSPNRFTPLVVVTPVPEPSTIALCAIGGLFFWISRFRRTWQAREPLK